VSATELILLRHGETDWNRERRIQGHLDTPLNAEGVRQAAAAADRLAGQADAYGLVRAPGGEPAVLLSSDLQRCRLTAEPIGRALGLATRLEPRLRERCYGAFEGLTHGQVQEALGERFERWLARDPDLAPAGGETLRGFAARVEDALREIVARHAGRTLVVVTHGGVLDVVHRLARGFTLTAPRDFELPNAALNRLRHDAGRFEVVDWGDVSHWQPALDEPGP